MDACINLSIRASPKFKSSGGSRTLRVPRFLSNEHSSCSEISVQGKYRARLTARHTRVHPHLGEMFLLRKAQTKEIWVTSDRAQVDHYVNIQDGKDILEVSYKAR